MNIALLDSENINKLSKGMLEDVDRIYIFTAQCGNDIKISWPSDAKPIKLNFLKCHGGGKNNMDHHIMSFLGYSLAFKKVNRVRVISNDQDYGNIIHFWRGKGFSVEQYYSVANKASHNTHSY